MAKRRRLIRVSPPGIQQHAFDPTCNVRQRHKRRMRFARKHRKAFDAYCRDRRLVFGIDRSGVREAWCVHAHGRVLLRWVPELGRAEVVGMKGVVFKIHDPFVLSWFIDGLIEVGAAGPQGITA